MTADTTIPDLYTFEFYVTDGAGSQSNHFTKTYTVVAPVSIAVTPMNPVITKSMTKQFAAVVTFPNSNTLDVTNQAIWSSSDTNKATINIEGLATAVGVGSVTMTAKFDSLSASTPLIIVSGFAEKIGYSSPFTNVDLGGTAIGDLNGDGRNDVAVIEDYGYRILIYYQNSQGIFDTPQVINVDTKLSLHGIVIADVNNDGYVDLIVSGTYGQFDSDPQGRIAVFRQNPTTHLLEGPQYYTLSAKSAGPLAVADLNGDGLPDIVSVGSSTGVNGVISLLFQSVTGILGPEVTYNSVPVQPFKEIHVADMNNDGLNDIVLQSSPLQLAVIKQMAPGVFSATPDFYTVQTSYWSSFDSFALGDLNGDGLIDVAVGDPGNQPYLNIFYQNASGLLTGPTLFPLPVNNMAEVNIGDLNGDGLNDVTISTGATVNIFYQGVDHTFSNCLTYSLPSDTILPILSVGDVNSDGLPDLVTSTWSPNGIFVLQRLP
jgi:Bacterial Ig-like domain (group 2)./FG-GAP repeat.